MITILKTIWLEEKSFLNYFVFASALLDDGKVVYDLFQSLKNRARTKFPIDGNELTKLGYSGQKLGDRLNYLKRKWIEK